MISPLMGSFRGKGHVPMGLLQLCTKWNSLSQFGGPALQTAEVTLPCLPLTHRRKRQTVSSKLGAIHYSDMRQLGRKKASSVTELIQNQYGSATEMF